VGGAHACGLTSDGSAFCWGNNSFGQLGDSTTIQRDVPTAVAGGLKFSALSAGYAHTCALAKPDGGVVCWGLNQAGELGNKTVGSQLTPRFIILGVTP
jgi:alpha-tubulin suppressor-like RCC1 family protein